METKPLFPLAQTPNLVQLRAGRDVGIDHQEMELFMNEDRKRLARKMDSEFFNNSDESPETQCAEHDAAGQLMMLLNSSPELADHLLQMTQLLRAKE